MIYVLGDSHVRTFALNKHFTPLFLGPGKMMNFISPSRFNETTKTTEIVINKLPSDAKLLFVFGEPDTRWCLGRGWHIQDKHRSKQSIVGSIIRYQQFIEELWHKKPIIFNVLPSERHKQNEMIRQWNQKIGQYCVEQNLQFINIYDAIATEHGLIKQQYQADWVHASFNVIPLVLRQLDINDNDVTTEDYERVKSMFNYDGRFGCLTL